MRILTQEKEMHFQISHLRREQKHNWATARCRNSIRKLYQPICQSRLIHSQWVVSARWHFGWEAIFLIDPSALPRYDATLPASRLVCCPQKKGQWQKFSTLAVARWERSFHGIWIIPARQAVRQAALAYTWILAGEQTKVKLSEQSAVWRSFDPVA
jgi:hypothetical protein